MIKNKENRVIHKQTIDHIVIVVYDKHISNKYKTNGKKI